jgi:hypothetical protein
MREVMEMKDTSQMPGRESSIACAVCRTHSRPLYVPWQQHAVGCPVRAAELQRRELELRPPLRVVSSLASF